MWGTAVKLWILVHLFDISHGQNWQLFGTTTTPTQNSMDQNVNHDAFTGEPLFMQFFEYGSASLPCNVSVYATDAPTSPVAKIWNDGRGNGIDGFGTWKDRISLHGTSPQCFFNVTLTNVQANDAGSYTIKISSNGTDLSRNMAINVTVSGLQFSVSPSSVFEGEKITLQCRNPSSLVVYSINIYSSINGVQQKKLATITMADPTNPSVEEADLRRRGAVATGTVSTANPSSSYLTLMINNTLCKDKREYKCVVTHDGSLEKGVASLTEIKTYPESLSMTVVSSSIYLNDVVRFTCTGKVGVPQQTIIWERQQYKDLDGFPYEITTNVTSVSNEDDINCQTKVDSTLYYTVGKDDQRANFTCRIRNYPVSASKIIFIEDVQDQTTDRVGGSTGDGLTNFSTTTVPMSVRKTTRTPDTNNAGVIAGAALGTLAFIILVVLIIVFIWYKKKSKGETYKTREPEEDGAPPLDDEVTYAQPNKKKDKNKGYVNKSLDEPHESRGPYTIADKYYENQQNNGYDNYNHGYDSRGRYNDGLEDDNTDVPKRAPSVSGSMGSAV